MQPRENQQSTGDPEDNMKLASEIASDLSAYGMTMAAMIVALHQSSQKLTGAIEAAETLGKELHRSVADAEDAGVDQASDAPVME